MKLGMCGFGLLVSFADCESYSCSSVKGTGIGDQEYWGMLLFSGFVVCLGFLSLLVTRVLEVGLNPFVKA